MQNLLKDYPSILEINVAWGEMDAAQHVNNTVFLRYAESGRLHYFTKLDFHIDTSGESTPVGPILAEANCKYKMPLTYPDTISVGTRVQMDSIDEYSFLMKQIIVSHKSARVAAEIQTKIVSYNYVRLEKSPLPQSLIKQMSNYQ